MNELTLKRKPNGYYKIELAGITIGEAWGIRSTKTNKAKYFAVQINNVYWFKGNPHTAGCPSTQVKRLQDFRLPVAKGLAWLSQGLQRRILY
jgi:hypothetical protein